MHVIEIKLNNVYDMANKNKRVQLRDCLKRVQLSKVEQLA